VQFLPEQPPQAIVPEGLVQQHAHHITRRLYLRSNYAALTKQLHASKSQRITG
jgi:hypothetical protein